MNPYIRLLVSNRQATGRRFEIVATADAAEAEVFLYDAIVASDEEAQYFGGVAPESFVKALRAIDAKTINLRINSPGGSVFAARAIERALRDHPARIVAHIDGLAASAASFVAMAADDIVMGSGSLIMIHKAWTFAYGNANDLIDTAALLEKIDGTLVQTYANRSGRTAEEVAAWMAAETWFTADEAIAAGLADRVAADAKARGPRWDLSAYGRQPAPADDSPPTTAAAIDAAAFKRRLEAALLPA